MKRKSSMHREFFAIFHSFDIFRRYHARPISFDYIILFLLNGIDFKVAPGSGEVWHLARFEYINSISACGYEHFGGIVAYEHVWQVMTQLVAEVF